MNSRPVSMRNKILFISHDASRTGAPILLLHFMRWLKAHSDVPFEIILRAGGQLEEEFRRLGPTTVLRRAYGSSPGHWEKACDYLEWPRSLRLRYIGLVRGWRWLRHVGLIYSNTLMNGELLERFAFLKCPVVTHVHELEHWIQFRLGLANFRRNDRHTTQYIACSRAVEQALRESFGVSPDRVELIHEFIAKDGASGPAEKIREQIREQLRVPADAFLVCGSGTIDWRKGPDLFVQLAHKVIRATPGRKVMFLWVGGHEIPELEKLCLERLRYDARKTDIEDQIRLPGTVSNPLDYFMASDLFVLASREDPFPLVMLEAASVGKPVVCFDRSGGGPEFVEDDCGLVIPYLDVDEMARRILHLIHHPSLCQELGRRAAAKVRERHSVNQTAPRILAVIRRFIPDRYGHAHN